MRGDASGAIGPSCEVESLEPRRLLSVQPVASYPFHIEQLTALGNEFFYRLTTAPDATASHELHLTDGTAAGTRRIRPPADGSGLPLNEPVVVARAGETLYLMAAYGGRLWSIDRRTSRAVPLMPPATTMRAYGAVEFRGHLYFAASDERGLELWRSDGTRRGTARVADLRPGSAGSEPWGFAVLRDRLYFSAATDAGARQLWSTDGTVQGTSAFWQVPPAPNAYHAPSIGSLTAAGGQLYFFAHSGDILRDFRLWVTNGTAAGTRVVPGDFQLSDRQFAAGTNLFFSAVVANRDHYLMTDGFSTKQLTQANGPVAVAALRPDDFAAFGDAMIFSSRYALGPRGNDYRDHPFVDKLWKAEPSGRLTLLHNGYAQHLTFLQHRVLFTNGDGDVFVTDGTRASTRPLGVQASELASHGATMLIASGKQLFKVDPSRGDITGSVWNDQDGDGARGAFERGLPGFRVYADLNRDRRLSSGEPSTRTAPDGTFHISGLTPGKHVVRMSSVPEWSYTTASAKTLAVAPLSSAAFNFGLRGTPGDVAGTVARDLNGNGRRDAGEAGLDGFGVFLDRNRNGRLDRGEPSRRTDARGRYRFDNLAAGDYRVALTPDALWLAKPGWHRDVTVPAAGDVVADFHLKPHVRLRGRVFWDYNTNGAFDAGEAPLSGTPVFLDMNQDGWGGFTEPSVVTDDAGVFEFRALARGAYHVRINGHAGITFSVPAQRHYVVAADVPRVVDDLDFGLSLVLT